MRRAAAWALVVALASAAVSPALAQFALESKRPARNEEVPTSQPEVIREPDFTAAPPRDGLGLMLAELDARRQLRVTKYSRDLLTGLLRAVAGDTLWLAAGARHDSLVAIALPDIARVQQWRSGSERGASIGATSGSVVGALFGLGLGALIASFNDRHASDLAPMIVAPLGGLAVGGTAGSLLGAGVGATTRSWYTVWPDEHWRAPPPASPQAPPPATRLLLEAGRSANTGAVYDVSGASLGIGLFRRQSPQLELGPAIRYQALDGVVDVPPRQGNGTYTLLEPIATISLDLRWQSPSPGLRPCLDGGLGFSLSNDLYPSAHLGAGLRARDGRGRDYGVVFRRHTALRTLGDGIDGYWTLAASFAFSL